MADGNRSAGSGVERLKLRRDFLAASKGARVQTGAFAIQAIRRADDESPGSPRVGFTVTKKVGCAVVRNRIKRRLREAVRLSAKGAARSGHDYVIIGRRAALAAQFSCVASDLQSGLARAHDALDSSQNRRSQSRKSAYADNVSPAVRRGAKVEDQANGP